MFKKKYLLFFILFLLGVFLFTSCLPKPPVTEGILKGQVIVPEGSAQAKDLTGQALPDATVNIIDLATGDIIATTTTDANGYYQVFVPTGGPYLLEAIKDGVKLQQFTPQVEVGEEYYLGTADCSTTSVALIAQAMMDAEDYPDNLADINLADIEADTDFNEVMSIVCSILEAGGDPTESALVQQAIEDFLTPPTPTPTPTPVANAEQAAPTGLAGVAPTSYGLTDGSITGTTTAMEYKLSTEPTTWTPATATEITGLAAGTYQVRYAAKTGYNAGTAVDVLVANGTPSLMAGTVSITGTAEFGQTLTADTTGLTYAPTTTLNVPTYQWKWIATPIPSATASTYTLVATDIGRTINVTVTADVIHATGNVTSAPTAAVAAASITAIGEIIGTPRVGFELTAGALTPAGAGATATYQWRISSDDITYGDITGATANTYNLVAGDVNKFVKVVATGTGNYSGTKTSTATAAVGATGLLVIGDSYGGGKVAYLLQSGDTIYDEHGVVLYSYDAGQQHGLIAAKADASVNQIVWSNITDASVGATGTAIGTGQANTALIVAQIGCTDGAAFLCYGLVEGGKSDWFLPSKDELNKLWENRFAIGNFYVESNSPYWSSSESSDTGAWFQGFETGPQSSAGKDSPQYVRAVRYF
jgi:hypothetical protein